MAFPSKNLAREVVIPGMLVFAVQVFGVEPPEPPERLTFEQYIKKSAVPKDILDQWLRVPSWVTFDPELGYILGNSLMPWGIDGTATIETIQANGARTTINYADRRPRINAYGDSFTESEQVSDGETWEEYLAGHLGEPVANFGVGGYGVYQAYRRMIREEKTDHGAKYLILTICCDDSTRSLLRSRRATFFEGWPEFGGMTFHGNFWSNVEMDLTTGKFVEKAQLLPTKESLYRMTEPLWMVEHLKDDLALQLTMYSSGRTLDMDRKKVAQLAKALDFPFDWTMDTRSATVPSPYADYGVQPMTPMQVQTGALLNRYSQRATIFILEKAEAFANANGKELLIVLNGNADITEMKQRGTREDQELVDYLVKAKIPFVDMNAIFLRDFQNSTKKATDFMAPYLVNGAGHFTPAGNHFIAYSIKGKLVELLDPKPIPYQQPNERQINFKGYLHGGVYH
jgi:hypothetical protein